MNEANVTRRTLSVLVENAAGVLSQVSRLFSRKGYNIESLAVGTTDDPAVSRITIEVWADKPMIEQIMNQLRKQFSVYSVQELLPERSIRRELVMFKVRAETPDIRNEIIQIANIFRASIIDVSLKSLTLALIGDETKADAVPARAASRRSAASKRFAQRNLAAGAIHLPRGCEFPPGGLPNAPARLGHADRVLSGQELPVKLPFPGAQNIGPGKFHRGLCVFI